MGPPPQRGPRLPAAASRLGAQPCALSWSQPRSVSMRMCSQSGSVPVGKVAVIRVGAPTNAELAVLTLGDVPQSPDRERLRARRAELGLPAGDEAPLIVDPFRGEAVDVQALPLHLRQARSTGVSLQADGGICRGLLRERYATVGVGEEEI